MRGTAEFRIIGRVGKIVEVGGTRKINIASDYPRRQQDGTWESNTHWNTVTIFNEKVIAWIDDNLNQGDLVQAEGTMRQNSYDKGHQTIYTVDLVTSRLNRLARGKDQGEHNEDRDGIPF